MASGDYSDIVSALMQNQNVPMPTPRPPQLDLLEQAKQQYPILNNYNIDYKYNPGGGPGYMESWPAGEPGTLNHPRPQDFPNNGFGVEVYDPQSTPDMVAADIASHYLRNTDPTIASYYDQFVSSLTPEQTARLQTDYAYARKNEGETRSFDQWLSQTRLPAYFRGYAFHQWPTDFTNKVYTPEQKAMFDKMISYMKGNK